MKKGKLVAKEKFVHNLFCTIAHRYDVMNSLLSFNQDRYWRQVAASKTGLCLGGKALDVACGTGRLTGQLAEMVGESGTVVGLDFCRNMLDIAAVYLAHKSYSKVVQLIEGDAQALPFADDSFDCVAVGFGLRNVPDIKAVLAEMRRVVRPGGTVISLDLAKPSALGFKQLYYLYFEYILPFVGKLGVGVAGPYHWLPQSLKEFPHQEELCALFCACGLKNTAYYELTGGVVAVHVGVK